MKKTYNSETGEVTVHSDKEEKSAPEPVISTQSLEKDEGVKVTHTRIRYIQSKKMRQAVKNLSIHKLSPDDEEEETDDETTDTGNSGGGNDDGNNPL